MHFFHKENINHLHLLFLNSSGFVVCFCRTPTDASMTNKRPPLAEDSEVYKMLQENQESDEPPRQSASFKVLQEILESGKQSN